MRPIIGIDFGTTNSLCALLDGDRPVIIPNSRGSRSTPSVVAMTVKGEALVGVSAKNQAYINPENTIAGVKRFLGSGNKLSMGAKSWRPEEIVALILGSLKKDAENYLSSPVDGAVVAAPAHFSDRERRALAEAGKLAGLEVLRIINEPTAAAAAHVYQRFGAAGPEKSLVLVYDYGGGTFDVTILRREGKDWRVLASRGDGRLGGDDLDRELRRLAVERFKDEGLDPEADRVLDQQLAEAAERAKIELSEREEASIALAFAAAGGRILHPTLDLRRSDFEEIARPYIERSLDLMEEAIRDAGVGRGDFDSLVLSGGSSRIPLVRRILRERLGLEPVGGVNPEEIVALGAAVWASQFSGSDEAAGGFRLIDVVSRSYGLEVDGGAFIPLIRKNSPVPAAQSRVFTTVSDGQDSVEIHVLQGESKVAAEDLSLGRFLLAGIRPAKAGSPRVKVNFTIDESDMLHVTAVDQDSGAEQAISIADIGRGASDDSREELARKASLLAGRLDDLMEGLVLERGLVAELDDLRRRALSAFDSNTREGELRMLKAELEGLVGELLARRAEARGGRRVGDGIGDRV
jgi:molecular chaperone DnaK